VLLGALLLLVNLCQVHNRHCISAILEIELLVPDTPLWKIAIVSSGIDLSTGMVDDTDELSRVRSGQVSGKPVKPQTRDQGRLVFLAGVPCPKSPLSSA
jgi:hypothetical protein